MQIEVNTRVFKKPKEKLNKREKTLNEKRLKNHNQKNKKRINLKNQYNNLLNSREICLQDIKKRWFCLSHFLLDGLFRLQGPVISH
jgi:hypothetical protein